MGSGYNYIREIMQMNLPEESTPKPLREYESEAKRRLNERFGAPKKFHYRYELRYPIRDDHDRDVCVIVDSANRWCHYDAVEGDVVMYNGKLYTWTGEKWEQFVPGPCTDYDGPNPYEKTIYISTCSESIDSPMAKAIRENLKKSLDEACAIGYYDTDDKTFVKEEKNMAKHNVFEETELCLTYIGTTTTPICENTTNERLCIDGTWIKSKTGYMTMWNGHLYVFAPDGMWHDLTATNVKPATDLNQLKSPGVYKYDKIPYGYLLIKKVHYNGDKTVVMWEDGTKTIVTRGENEVFDPEKGLVMAITKKAYGNHGNYYNRIKKWLPEIVEPSEPESVTDDATVSPMLHKTAVKIGKKAKEISSLLADMVVNGATNDEIERVVQYSMAVIDTIKSGETCTRINKEFNIKELKAKYQPE